MGIREAGRMEQVLEGRCLQCSLLYSFPGKLVLCSLSSEWIILWCKWIDSWTDLAVPSQWIKRKNKGRKRSLISKKIACHPVWLVKSIFPSITCVLLHMPVILVDEFDHTVTPRLCFKEKVSMIHLFLHIANAYWATVRYLVLDVFGSDPSEDLSQGFHASLLLLETCSQHKLKRGEKILGFSESRSFLCVVKTQRKKLTVKSILSELWFWFCLVVALHEFFQKLSWDCLAQLSGVTSI